MKNEKKKNEISSRRLIEPKTEIKVPAAIRRAIFPSSNNVTANTELQILKKKTKKSFVVSVSTGDYFTRNAAKKVCISERL